VQNFDFYKLPQSNITNANILCLVRFSSGRNKLVQLLIRVRNIFGRTVQTLLAIYFKHSILCSIQREYVAVYYSLVIFSLQNGTKHKKLFVAVKKH